LNRAKRFPGARWERAGLCLFHLNKANEAAAYLKSLRDEFSEVEIAAALKEEGLESEWSRMMEQFSGKLWPLIRLSLTVPNPSSILSFSCLNNHDANRKSQKRDHFPAA
jgi:hypothetical protein